MSPALPTFNSLDLPHLPPSQRTMILEKMSISSMNKMYITTKTVQSDIRYLKRKFPNEFDINIVSTDLNMTDNSRKLILRTRKGIIYSTDLPNVSEVERIMRGLRVRTIILDNYFETVATCQEMFQGILSCQTIEITNRNSAQLLALVPLLKPARISLKNKCVVDREMLENDALKIVKELYIDVERTGHNFSGLQEDVMNLEQIFANFIWINGIIKDIWSADQIFSVDQYIKLWKSSNINPNLLSFNLEIFNSTDFQQYIPTIGDFILITVGSGSYRFGFCLIYSSTRKQVALLRIARRPAGSIYGNGATITEVIFDVINSFEELQEKIKITLSFYIGPKPELVLESKNAEIEHWLNSRL